MSRCEVSSRPPWHLGTEFITKNGDRRIFREKCALLDDGEQVRRRLRVFGRSSTTWKSQAGEFRFIRRPLQGEVKSSGEAGLLHHWRVQHCVLRQTGKSAMLAFRAIISPRPRKRRPGRLFGFPLAASFGTVFRSPGRRLSALSCRDGRPAPPELASTAST